jgi:hypothetical protein
MSSTFASYREVTDANGRVYRVGETDRELLGRSRAWMIWLPWMAMMAISVYEYGYGAAAKSIREAHHWSMSETFWLLSIWAFFQAGVAFPAGKLREKGILSARAAMLIGAVLSALGFASITQGNLVLAYLGFAVCGGIGAGRQVVSGAARRQDRICQRRIRLWRSAVHLHLQLRVAPEHLRLGPRPGGRVHADRLRGMRLALP